jgi:hypothetical protein
MLTLVLAVPELWLMSPYAQSSEFYYQEVPAKARSSRYVPLMYSFPGCTPASKTCVAIYVAARSIQTSRQGFLMGSEIPLRVTEIPLPKVEFHLRWNLTDPKWNFTATSIHMINAPAWVFQLERLSVGAIFLLWGRTCSRFFHDSDGAAGPSQVSKNSGTSCTQYIPDLRDVGQSPNSGNRLTFLLASKRHSINGTISHISYVVHYE